MNEHRAEEAAAREILHDRFRCSTFTRHWTEGRTIVAEGRGQDGSVVLKATAEDDVRVETSVYRLIRRSGVSVVPEVVATGVHCDLPGGRWFVMTKAAGVPWSPEEDAGLDRRVQASLAKVLFGIHRIHMTGFGELDASGRGRCGTWSEWVCGEVEAATAALRAAGYLTRSQRNTFVDTYERHAPLLDPGAGSLLHADLDPGEVFIDPTCGDVLGVVDWGGAIAGDPWMDLARFAAGGPADDERRPVRLQPGLIRSYEHRAGPGAEHAVRLALYRLLWSLRHARSYLNEPDEQAWTPGLINQALRRLADLDTRHERAR